MTGRRWNTPRVVKMVVMTVEICSCNPGSDRMAVRSLMWLYEVNSEALSDGIDDELGRPHRETICEIKLNITYF